MYTLRASIKQKKKKKKNKQTNYNKQYSNRS